MRRSFWLPLAAALFSACSSNQDWRTASRESAWIGRRVPELGLELPLSAIGSGHVVSR